MAIQFYKGLDINGDIEITNVGPIFTSNATNGTSGLRLNTTGGTGGSILRVQESGSTKFQINYNGNVGIGTTGPNAKLDVASSATNTVPFRVGVSGGTTGSTMYEDTGGHLWFQMFDTSASEKVRIRTNSNSFFTGGNVGIGTTTPNSKLDVSAGDINISTGVPAIGSLYNKLNFWSLTGGEGVGASIGAYRGSNYVSGGLIFETGELTPSERMRIDLSGNVGIGTNNPAEKLDVNGTVNLTNLKIANAQGTDGQVLTSTGSGVAWEDVSGGGVTTVVADTTAGRKGIEVTTNSGTATVGLDVDNLQLSLNNPDYIAGSFDGDNIKAPPYILHAYNTWLGGIDGDGTTSVFTVTHDLGSKVIIQIVDIAVGSSTEGENVYPKMVRSGNTVTITFPTAPNANAAFDVLITKIVTRPA